MGYAYIIGVCVGGGMGGVGSLLAFSRCCTFTGIKMQKPKFCRGHKKCACLMGVMFSGWDSQQPPVYSEH